MTDEPRCRWNGPTSARVLAGRHGGESIDPIEAVQRGEHIRAFSAADRNMTHAQGRVIAYCDAPQFLIETDDGTKIWWRVDLCTRAEESA